MTYLPPEPRYGAPVSAEWGAQVVRFMRYLRDRQSLPREESRAVSIIQGAASTPQPFEVIAVPITPTPTTGARQNLVIYGGRYNEELAVVNGTTPLSGVATAVSVAGLPTTGAWGYVYLQINDGGARPQVLVGAVIPFDGTSGYDYIALAAVRAVAAGTAYDWDVVQLVSGDITRPVKPALSCTVAREEGANYLSMRPGKLAIAVQNWGVAALFDDTAHRPGERSMAIPGFQNVPVPATTTMSLWVAVEYPKGVTGSTLPDANWGNVQLTSLANKPANRPWIIIAEKNKNDDTAQDDLGTGVPIGTTPEDGAEAEEKGQQQDGAWAGRKLDEQAPPAGSWDYVADVITAGATTTGTYTGLGGTIEWSKTVATKTRTWRLGGASGAIVKTASQEYTSTLGVNYSTGVSPNTGSNYNPTEDGKVGTGYPPKYSGLSTAPVSSYGYEWQSWAITTYSRYDANTHALLTSGSLIIDNGVVVAYMKADRQVFRNWRGWATDVAGFRSDTAGSVGASDRWYGDGGGGTPNAADPANPDPAHPDDPKSDSPGRPRRGSNPGSIQASGGTTTGATAANGSAITSPGPGLYVFEIARIYPDGRMDQCRVGDIVFHPAPQICLRENPKIAALP